MSAFGQRLLITGLRWLPLVFLGVVMIGFATLSTQFATFENFGAILVQSSWLIIVALGANFVLLTAGVDLSAGAAMYLAAVAVGLTFAGAPVWLALPGSILAGLAFGALNGLFIARWQLPAFVVTLATAFMGRGVGLYLSATQNVPAGPLLADFGRAEFMGVAATVLVALVALLGAWLLLRGTSFGLSVHATGADRECARRSGVPVDGVVWKVYCLAGAFAGLGGFVSLCQTSAASAAFGQNAEFLAIAAAVLGGTSLFGGRGTVWAPVAGAVLITTVQNGLVMVNANPYAYPVISGVVIFLAALLDSIRSGVLAGLNKRMIYR